VASAGNDGAHVGIWEQYPASSDSVITVGAIGADDRWLSYSSVGLYVDVVAGSATGLCANKAMSADTVIGCSDTANTYYAVDRMDTRGYNPKKILFCLPKQDNVTFPRFRGQ